MPVFRFAKTAAATTLLVLAVPAFAQSPGPSRAQGSSTARGTDARFGLVQAIETAERESKGRALSAEFTPFPKGGGALEVTIMRPDASVTKYRLDANTGAVVNVTEQTVEAIVSQIDPAALGRQKLSMTQAISATEKEFPGGTAMGAEVQRTGENLTFEVSVLKDGKTVSLVVNENGSVLKN